MTEIYTREPRTAKEIYISHRSKGRISAAIHAAARIKHWTPLLWTGKAGDVADAWAAKRCFRLIAIRIGRDKKWGNPVRVSKLADDVFAAWIIGHGPEFAVQHFGADVAKAEVLHARLRDLETAREWELNRNYRQEVGA